MLNFEAYINLPMVWGAIIITAIILYVLLDGFTLGVGILFPFAPSNSCKEKMVNSIAPFWDGNETWLVLGGGGLFAAFPLAYSIIMPAVYMPLLFMLIALIFRGVAFEFRFKADDNHKAFWGLAFHFGSLMAAFMQGMMFGTLIDGITVENNAFAGKPFDWLTAFSIMTGLALVFGYVLLASTWLVMKTDGVTQTWGRKVAKYSMIYVVFFMIIASIWMPFVEEEVFKRWFSWPNIAFLCVVPIITALTVYGIYVTLSHHEKRFEKWPFFLSYIFFLLGFAGMIINAWPYVIPRSITLSQAAAAPESQSLMLVATVIILPMILFYVGYCYYVFRGKVTDQAMYEHH